MKNTGIFLIIFILMFPCVVKAEEITLSLDEAITIAIRDNRDILLKTEDVKKAKAKIAEAESSLFPSLTLTGGLSDTRSLYGKDVDAYSSHVGAKQILYKGGQVINTIKINEYNYTATQAMLDKAKLDIIFAVKQAFYTLLLSYKFVAINKQILDNTNEHLAVLEARFANGESSESDLIKIRSSLANVSQAYETSRNQIQAAGALLNNLLSFDKEVGVLPQGEFTYEPREIAYDQAFLQAMQSRPEIKQLQAQQKMAEKSLDVAKADNRPQVYASWDYYSGSRSGAGSAAAATPSKNWNDYNVVGITVSWPIFDGWLTKAKVDQAIIDVKEAELLKQKTTRDIALELKTAYLDLRDAIEKIKSQVEQTVVYKDNLSVFQEKYNAGIVSELDVHDVQVSYDIALFNQIQANYDYVLAKAKFDKATGGTI
jgi:outer membrane protein TolC